MEPVNPYAAPAAASSEAAAAAPDQPLSLMAALNTGTSLYLRRFPTWAAMTLAIWLPLELFVSYQEYFVLDPDDVAGVLRWSVLGEAFVGIIAVGGTISVGEAELRGERRGWLSGLGEGLRGWPRIFSSRFVGGLAVLIAALLFLLPALYLGARFSLSDSVAILERRAGTGAVGRSLELTRGRFLIFFALCTITIVPILIAGFVVFLPLQFFPEYNHWVLSAALACVANLLEPWMTLVFVAAYVQCRAEEQRERPSTASAGPEILVS
jgi:hypothetical protein